MNFQYSLKSIGKNSLECGIIIDAIKQQNKSQEKDKYTMASKNNTRKDEHSNDVTPNMTNYDGVDTPKRTRKATIFMSPLTRKLVKSQADAMEISAQNLVDALVLQFVSPVKVELSDCIEKTKDGLDRTTYKALTDAYWSNLEAENRRMRRELYEAQRRLSELPQSTE